jgi:uncharacterized protein YfaS (alpha-2-macroglobulin family)
VKRLLLIISLGLLVPLALYWFIPSKAEGAALLQVLRITPAGKAVNDLRQIVFEFNRAIVPLGEMKRSSKDIPITIKPEVNCEWRWLNPTTLSCNLDEKNALSLATHYKISVDRGLVAHDGAHMAAAYSHEFSTQGPTIQNIWLEIWKSPQHPQIRLLTNQPVTQKSLQRSLSFINKETKKNVAAVRVEEIIELDSQGRQYSGYEHRQWRVEPSADLPAKSTIVLQLSPGLNSLLGPESSNENRALFTFDTFADFAFLGLECTTHQDKVIRITRDTGQNVEQLCNPLSPINLLFNAPVARNKVLKQIQVSPDLAGAKSSDSEDAGESDLYLLSRNHSKDDVYRVRLPTLKPSQRYNISYKKLIGSESGLYDLFERNLSNALQGTVITGHLKPNYYLPYHYAILELNTDSDIPLEVTNLKSWYFHYHGINSAGEIKEKLFHQSVPAVLDMPFAMPLKIREHLEHKSGVLYGQIGTDPQVKKYSTEALRLFAEVTPYQLHVKLGHFNTLVWVTDLATGAVISHAKVTLYQDTLSGLHSANKPLATAVTDQQGIAILPGTAVIDPMLELNRNQWDDDKSHLFIRVDKKDQLAVLPLNYDFEVSTWRSSKGTVNDYQREKNGHIVTWGTTAQGVYRLGDTVQYKFYVRNQSNEALKPAPRQGYSLQIIDPTGKVIHEVSPITLSEFGAADGQFTLSKQGAVGWYQFELINNENERHYEPMRVLVSDFTPAPFKVTQDLNGDLFQAGQIVTVTTQAKLHSGGPYNDASTRVSATLESSPFVPTTLITQGFDFSSASEAETTKELYQAVSPLNKNGELKSQFTMPSVDIYYGKIRIESAVQDDRGKNIAALSQVPFSGVDRFVGLKKTDWISSTDKPLKIQTIVVDAKGKPVPGAAVSLTLERRQITMARIKDVGTTYTTHTTTEWQHHSDCQVVSTTEPLSCEFKPSISGDYRVKARVKDSRGKEQVTQTSLWVSGTDAILWDENNENFLEILAEKTSAVVGETARFLIKNPYPKAKALITVERYGVIDRFVKTLDSSSPVIEIPIKPSYLPGFYLSVTIQSPRVAKPKEAGNVDLGKPTFSMGYISVPVIDRYKEINVIAKTDQEIYRPRDKIKVKLHAQPKIKTAKSEPIELAVAVIDEAVFDLLSGGNKNYDPYRGLYQFDQLDLRNYSLLTRLVGRQKFETKGANPGGDGGVDVSMRSIFKYISYWQPSLRTDAQGNAKIEFDAPDNLTGWRVLVLAVTLSDRAGLGVAQFKVNRPTEIRTAMPNQVVEGDTFKANFTVMNRTQQTRHVKVAIRAQGNIDSKATASDYMRIVDLAPYQRATVSMPVRAQILPLSAELLTGSIRFVVRAGDSIDADVMEHTLTIEKNRSLETSASYGTTTANHVAEAIVIPENIYTDTGSIAINLSSSVIASVEGAFRYLRDYPYECWEQRLSKSVIAEIYQQLKSYVPRNFIWEASSHLAQKNLNLASNFQAPNGGMCYFNSNDERADPYLSAYTALAFHWLREDGKTIPTAVENKLHDYLLNFLRRNASPEYYSENMTDTVRATALAALAQQHKINLTDLTRLQPKFASMNLLGQAHFIQAALATSGAEKMAKELIEEMLGHSAQTAGKFMLTARTTEEFSRILSSPLRDNCAALDTLVTVAKMQGLESVGDIPFKLVRTITETRKSRDHWENTQENLYCMRALANYSRVYESQPADMQVSVRLDNESLGKVSFKQQSAQPTTLIRPLQKIDPGRHATVHIDHEGRGRLYYATTLSSASINAGDATVNAGMELKRQYSVLRDKKWVLLKSPMKLQRGEVVRVDLYLSLPRPGNFVVINDPIPGALEPVNRDLATASSVDAESNVYQPSQGSAWFNYKLLIEYNAAYWGFYHQELHNEVARFYSDYLTPGNYHLYYMAQVVAEGTFIAKAPLAQEMYDPDVQGRDATATLIVGESP